MSIPQVLTLTLTLVATAACSALRGGPAVEMSTADATLNSRWHANLASPANLAGAVQMNGSATMAPGSGDNSTTITLNLANASPGGVHPWAAHRGQCGAGMDNGVLGSGEAYPALKVDPDGRATETATVSLPTPRTGNYFVVVRASTANTGTIVACGNLAPPTQ
jgi:hypothetical protein